MGDPAQLQKAMSVGVFASSHTEDQVATLESIETLLALVEGWVDDVTAQAAAPHLAHLGALREMTRRRRAAGGPAEHTFATLLGLELRPRRLRDAADLWASLRVAAGTEARDAVWSHPISSLGRRPHRRQGLGRGPNDGRSRPTTSTASCARCWATIPNPLRTRLPRKGDTAGPRLTRFVPGRAYA